MFERMITRLIKEAAPILYRAFVTEVSDCMSMTFLKENCHRFAYHPCALYVTDTMFRQANRPCGNMFEARPYFTANHKLQGFKTEAFVLPDGIFLILSDRGRGGETDTSIFWKRLKRHEGLTEKYKNRSHLSDVEESEQLNWAILVDIGYQGLQSVTLVVIPKTFFVQSNVTHEKNKPTKKIGRDRVIVKNFFGRLTNLWVVIANRLR